MEKARIKVVEEVVPDIRCEGKLAVIGKLAHPDGEALAFRFDIIGQELDQVFPCGQTGPGGNPGTDEQDCPITGEDAFYLLEEVVVRECGIRCKIQY